MKLRRTLLAGCAAATALWGGSALADTLAEAIRYAYETDPGIAAQRASLRALDEGYVQARAALGPNISLTVGGQDQTLERSVGSDTTDFAGRPRHTQTRAQTDSSSITLQQPLYVGGRGHARITASEARVEAGREQLRRAELDLIMRVVSAYLSVRRDEEIVRISADAVQVLEKQLANSQAKFDVRQVTATDLNQSVARLEGARTDLILAQSQLEISRSLYLEAVGKNPTDLAPEPPLTKLPGNLGEALDIAERNNPALLGAGYTEQVSRAQIAEAKGVGRPNVNLRIEGRKGVLDPSDERSARFESVTASLSLTQPLFTSGAIKSQVRQAVAENERDKFNTENVRKQVIQDVNESWASLTATRRSLVTLENVMKANEVAFYGVREEERFALRTTLDILNAEAELRQSQLNLIRSRATEYVRRAQLLAVIGALDVNTLSSGVTPYDPEDNFKKVQRKGQTPWEPLVRAIDELGGARIPPPRPATREGTRPAEASTLPPAPVDAASRPPIVPTSELVARRTTATGGGQGTAPGPASVDGVGELIQTR